MNNVVGSIFNESFVEKRGLWVPSIVHGSTSYSETRFCQKKKTKTKTKTKCKRRDVDAIQTHT